MIDRGASELADYCGVASSYLDFKKDPVTIPEENRTALLGTLGFDLEDSPPSELLAGLIERDWQSILEPIVIARPDEPVQTRLHLPARYSPGEICLLIELEKGGSLQVTDLSLEVREERRIAGQTVRGIDIGFHANLPAGRHRLALRASASGGSIAHTLLLAAPRSCYEPASLQSGERVSGLCLQLYTLRSERNWGMGDFTDLSALVIEAAKVGLDLLGINPLHALFTQWPLHFSPYSPSNRAFLNVLYIDPEAVPEFATCEPARDLVASEIFRNRLDTLRATKKVDYVGVSDCKLQVLRYLFEHFWVQDRAHGTPRALAYREFLRAQGEQLWLHATYETLHAHFFQRDNALWGWPVWPEEYRDPGAESVRQFAEDHAKEVHFHQYLQWNTFGQLRQAQEAAVQAGMKVGIYLDLAVGVDTAGSEAWANQAMFAFDASVGAPPDLLAREGQDWGFPPFDPIGLRRDAYRLFSRNLRANMSCAGAVRVDHCVSLQHLWWIPRASDASGGGYVRYDVDEMMATLVLESDLNRCLVVGEDLGTVPDAITAHMLRDNLYSYKVLYFEKERASGDLIPPDAYPRSAVATITTHDLPTLASWWDLSDLHVRTELGLLGTRAVQQELRDIRKRDKQALLDLLHELDFLPQRLVAEAVPEMTGELNLAVHRYLASSRSLIMMSQIEDWMGMRSPVNIPGTSDEHPNWQRKLRYSIEGFFDRPEVRALCEGIRAARAG